MHGQKTSPGILPTHPRHPRTAFRALAAAVAWLALGGLCTAQAAPESAGPEGGYRTLHLAPEEESDVRLLAAGSFLRHLPGAQEGSLTVRSNWRRLTIPAGPNGHFYVTARVKKRPPSYSLVDVTFLVDTGASLVALTRADAAALGFERRHLDFSGISQTANGEVRFASVMLPELRVGSFKVRNLPASVVDGDLQISLLGNTFLSQLKSYQVANDELVLRW